MTPEETPEAAKTRCDSCKAQCIWTTTERGKQLLVDVQPGVAGGNLSLSAASGVVRSRVVKPGLAFGNRTLHLAHFATCPQAAQHRNKRGR